MRHADKTTSCAQQRIGGRRVKEHVVNLGLGFEAHDASDLPQ